MRMHLMNKAQIGKEISVFLCLNSDFASTAQVKRSREEIQYHCFETLFQTQTVCSFFSNCKVCETVSLPIQTQKCF